jgi:hypothetical protein
MLIRLLKTGLRLKDSRSRVEEREQHYLCGGLATHFSFSTAINLKCRRMNYFWAEASVLMVNLLVGELLWRRRSGLSLQI